MKAASRNSVAAGFTLIELLLVTGLVILLAVLSIPAMNSVGAGLNLTRSGQSIADQLVLARQTAITRNRNVEVRFVEVLENGNRRFKALQTWLVDEDGTNTSALGRLIVLPPGVLIDTNLAYSPLLFGSGATLAGEATFGAQGSCAYKGFRFRPGGTTDIPSAATNQAPAFLMLRLETATQSPPDNFVMIQVNNLTGRTSILRP